VTETGLERLHDELAERAFAARYGLVADLGALDYEHSRPTPYFE
jgi:hypothetical protein